jgi:hypothetical protein
MLNHIWNNFGFKWDTFVKVLSTYQSVFWVILVGYIVHWLPQKIKDLWENLFKRFPLPLQAVAVAIIVILMYQAVSDTFKPFAYFEY